MKSLGCLNASVAVVAALALFGAAGCSGTSSTDTSGDGGSAPVHLEGVTLVGVTAAEASQLVTARPDNELKPKPTFTSPAPVSEYVPTSEIPKFSWTFEDGSARGMREVSYLRFAVPAQKPLLELVTDETSFTPSKDQWEKMSLGQWVAVDIFSGLFQADTMQGDAAEGLEIQFCSMPEKPAK